MDKESVIEKIKKLLRMKRGGTLGEIENALAAAAKLAREHGIDLEGVNPDEEPAQRITHVEDILKLRLPIEARYAANILVNYFNVQICLRKGHCVWWSKIPNKIVFVGTAWDCEVARYVFVFLQQHFRYCWNHRPNRRLKNRDAFMHGMYIGLSNKLWNQQPKPEAGEGLIAVDRAIQLRNEYLKKLVPNAEDQELKKDDSDAWRAKRAGIRAGEETEIRQGLNKSAAPARPSLPPAVGQLALI